MTTTVGPRRSWPHGPHTPTRPPAPGRTVRTARLSRSRRDQLTALVFLLPVILALLGLRLLPAVDVVADSLRRGLPGSGVSRFVGIDNFRALADSDSFWNSVQQTLVFNLLVNPLQIGAALLLAVLFTSRLPAAGLWRTVVFLPSAVPILGSTIIWGIALRPEGPVNGVITALGGGPQRFFTSPGQVLWSLILLASWIGIGYWMTFLIAGLRDIPGSYYEAARLDGAGALRQFLSITLPLLRRPLLFVLVADTVANFVLFAPIQVLTDGGPEEASNLLMYDVFRTAYQLSDPYLAAAELLVLLVLMLAIVMVQFRLLRESDES